MRTITLAGTKGGIGKTTICFNIAVEAARKHGVLFADLDPQQSLADLWRRRGGQENPLLVENVATVSDAARRLKQAGLARDFFMIDTPGSNISVIRDAIMAADLVVLPVQPSPMDLLAQEAVCDLVVRAGKSNRALFVLNRVDARSALGKQAREWLLKHRPFPVAEIHQRAAYTRAAVVGKSGAELDKGAAGEVKRLWAKIEEMCNE